MKRYKKLIIGMMIAGCCWGTNAFATNMDESFEVVRNGSNVIQKTDYSKKGSFIIKDIDYKVSTDNYPAFWRLLAIKYMFDNTYKKLAVTTDKYDVSIRHMAYSTSSSFRDGPIKFGLNRDAFLTLYTLTEQCLAYFTNGIGPINNKGNQENLQIMMYNNNGKEEKSSPKISVSEIENITGNVRIKDWIKFDDSATTR